MELPFDPADFSYFEPRCECCFDGGCLCPISHSTNASEYQSLVREIKQRNDTNLDALDVSFLMSDSYQQDGTECCQTCKMRIDELFNHFCLKGGF